MSEITILINGKEVAEAVRDSLTEVPDHLARSILTAAERGDKFAFAAAARRLGSLEDAQALVRSKGIVRMADRVTVTRDAGPEASAPLVRDDEARDVSSEAGGPTMFGHFAVFDEWTEIDSYFEGNFVERIAPGAFRKTFKENQAEIRSLFQHGFDPQIGDKPLGTINTLREDDIGAYYEVPLLDAAYVRDDVLPGLKAGLYGASFRFQMMREMFDTEPAPSEANPKGLPERTLKELRVFEFGPVTFPAYRSATAAVRLEEQAAAEQRAYDQKIAEQRQRLAELLPGDSPAPADGDAGADHHPARKAAPVVARHLPARARRGTRNYDRKEVPSWLL